MPVPGLVHRYPDRVLFLVTDRCAAYCRYCTRSRLVSNAQNYDFHPEFESGLKYIDEHAEVRDVLLSGGDPLLLADNKLDYLLGRLRAIPHVEFIRIGSRIPVFLPQRITPALCEIFKKHGPIWMSIHINHPRECTVELKEACDRLAFAGVPLGNQSVLLRGVNDDAETMKSLVHRLLQMRVRPVLPLPVRPHHRQRALARRPAQRRRNHPRPPRPHHRLRRPAVRHRRPRRRRQGAAQSQLRRRNHRERNRPAQFRRRALPAIPCPARWPVCKSKKPPDASEVR